jgi:hypothetical protein
LYQLQIRHAQLSAPFGDGRGLVAATLQAGDTLPPYEQCLSTPFQCIATRVGLAATTWAILADLNVNPFTQLTGVGGTTTIGLYRPGTNTFFLRNSNSFGAPDLTIPFGTAGDLPVVGDWDGNGSTTIGLYRPSTNTFFLRNSNVSGPPDLIVPLGRRATCLVGEGWRWTTPGVTVQAATPLLDINTSVFAIIPSVHRRRPVVGDWDATERRRLPYRPSTTRTSCATATASRMITSSVHRNDLPVVGDWDGNGITSVAPRPSSNTSSSATTTRGVAIIPFGTTNDAPIAQLGWSVRGRR